MSATTWQEAWAMNKSNIAGTPMRTRAADWMRRKLLRGVEEGGWWVAVTNKLAGGFENIMKMAAEQYKFLANEIQKVSPFMNQACNAFYGMVGAWGADIKAKEASGDGSDKVVGAITELQSTIQNQGGLTASGGFPAASEAAGHDFNSGGALPHMT